MVKSAVAKWIFGILAAIFFGLCIFLIVEGYLVRKRRREAMRSVVRQEMGKPDFAQKMAEAQKRRDILFKGQRTDEPDV